MTDHFSIQDRFWCLFFFFPSLQLIYLAQINFFKNLTLGVMAHYFNANTQEADAGEYL